MHAYGIHQQVMKDSSQTLYFSFTSLRRILNEFESHGLVEMIGVDIAGSQEIPVYEIKSRGKSLLKSAAIKLARAAKLAEDRLA
jgi:DNA-binding PadR family transcriptional regulator